MVVDSAEQRRDSAMHRHAHILLDPDLHVWGLFAVD